jgi:hypothetical protein
MGSSGKGRPLSDTNLISCWMCGGIADSREHIFKASDLRRIFDKDGYAFENLPFHFKSGQHRRIPGPKSALMKYEPNLCSNCNNNVSSPYDLSYEMLSKWFDTNKNINAAGEIDFTDVFGDQIRPYDGIYSLYQYCSKALGCRILSSGHVLPRHFPNPISDNCCERLKISICRLQVFRHLPDYLPEHGEMIFGKGDLLATLSGVDREIVRCIWWENIGHFQLTYWFNIPSNSLFGEELSYTTRLYCMNDNGMDLNELKQFMSNWLRNFP